jgi:hypothetical protein
MLHVADAIDDDTDEVWPGRGEGRRGGHIHPGSPPIPQRPRKKSVSSTWCSARFIQLNARTAAGTTLTRHPLTRRRRRRPAHQVPARSSVPVIPSAGSGKRWDSDCSQRGRRQAAVTTVQGAAVMAAAPQRRRVIALIQRPPCAQDRPSQHVSNKGSLGHYPKSMSPSRFHGNCAT